MSAFDESDTDLKRDDEDVDEVDTDEVDRFSKAAVGR